MTRYLEVNRREDGTRRVTLLAQWEFHANYRVGVASTCCRMNTWPLLQSARVRRVSKQLKRGAARNGARDYHSRGDQQKAPQNHPSNWHRMFRYCCNGCAVRPRSSLALRGTYSGNGFAREVDQVKFRRFVDSKSCAKLRNAKHERAQNRQSAAFRSAKSHRKPPDPRHLHRGGAVTISMGRPGCIPTSRKVLSNRSGTSN